MNKNEYTQLYTSLNLSTDQRSFLVSFLDEALEAVTIKGGASDHYVRTVNAITLFISGDLNANAVGAGFFDEFFDEFSQTSIQYDIESFRKALNAFELENAEHADTFKIIAGEFKECLTRTLNEDQFVIFMTAMTALFKIPYYHCTIFLSELGQQELLDEGAFLMTKLSFAFALGVIYGQEA